DDALDLFDMLIADIAVSAKNLGQKKRIRSLRDLDEAALALAEVCSILLDDTHLDEEVRTAVFTQMTQEQIAQAITTTYDLARPPEADYQEEMLTRYRPVRRFLPRVLDTITFKAAPAGDSVLTAVHYLKGLQGRRKPHLDDAPLDVVDPGSERLVNNKPGDLSQPAYTLCVMERVPHRVCRRGVCVAGAD